MLIKRADDKSAVLTELEALLKAANRNQKHRIEDELRAVSAGLKGERESAYLIDFDYEKSNDMAVIHDLRLEVNGRVAQIDHLLIHRTLQCFVLETKHFHTGLKITENGEFLRWNEWQKNFGGMASPLAQNERHIAVLQDAFAQLLLPTRSGVPLVPVFHSFVLISPDARIDRPVQFDTSQVIKADLLQNAIQKQFDKAGLLALSGNTEHFLSSGALENTARQLIAFHKPAVFDFMKKFGFSRENNATLAATRESYKDFTVEDATAATLPFDKPRQRKNTSRRSITRISRLIYAGTLLAIGLALTRGVMPNISALVPGQEPAQFSLPKLPVNPNRQLVPFDAQRKAKLAPSPAANQTTPLITLPESTSHSVRTNEHSLSVFGKEGAQIGEIRGNLAKIKQEMQQSRWGSKPIESGEPAAIEATVCEPKPVMTNEEIIACRKSAARHQ